MKVGAAAAGEQQAGRDSSDSLRNNPSQRLCGLDWGIEVASGERDTLVPGS